MKNLKIYCIYDSKAQTYSQPFFQLNEACCERSVQSMANDGSMYSKSPEDFICFEIGEYDETTGIISANETPISKFNFIQFKGDSDA